MKTREEVEQYMHKAFEELRKDLIDAWEKVTIGEITDKEIKAVKKSAREKQKKILQEIKDWKKSQIFKKSE